MTLKETLRMVDLKRKNKTSEGRNFIERGKIPILLETVLALKTM